MKPGIVYYKTDKKWKKLKHLDYTFDNMENAIKYIRHQYSIMYSIAVKLKFMNKDSSILFWDNY
jgi:hypothetical protein